MQRLLTATAFLMLASCVTTVDGIWISGRSRDVPQDDIRRAIAVCSHGGYVRKVRPRQVDVINPDEIHVYWFERKAVYGGHDIAKRVHGRWTCDETVVVIE